MSHDTQHGNDRHPENNPMPAYSFWLVVILVGLFISAINFVNVMGNDDGEGNKITDVPKPVEAPREATASQTLAGENGEGKRDTSKAINKMADTATAAH